MHYQSVKAAVEQAFSEAGYEAPIRTLTPEELAGAEYDHSKRPSSDLTRQDWLGQHGLAHRTIRNALGGYGSAQYLTLLVRYCYHPAIRIEAQKALLPHLPGRMPPLKRQAVVAMWGGVYASDGKSANRRAARGAIKLTYADIDMGDGTPTSTLERHIGEVRRQLDSWHNAAFKHLDRVLVDAGLLAGAEEAC